MQKLNQLVQKSISAKSISAKNNIVFKSLQQKQRNNIHFFLKKDKFVDPETKKIRIHEISKYAVAGITIASWIFILRWWYTAEDRAFVKAEKYLEEKRKRGDDSYAATQQQMLDEEYRSEYIEKTKRKYQRILKQKQEDELEKIQIRQQREYLNRDD